MKISDFILKNQEGTIIEGGPKLVDSLFGKAVLLMTPMTVCSPRLRRAKQKKPSLDGL